MTPYLPQYHGGHRYLLFIIDKFAGAGNLVRK
jgi:hypothetical protein